MADDTPTTPLDAFRQTFREDVENDSIRPLSDYLAQFRGDDASIASEYRAAAARILDGTPRASEEPAADRLGPYRIIQEIGRGAQGTVYLAEEVALGRRVALKVLDTGLTAHPEAIARFRREAAITSKLDNPGICPVYATGSDGGSFWIAMRYVEGDSLAKKIASAKENDAEGNSFVFDEQVVVGADARKSPGTDPSGPNTWVEIARILSLFEHIARTLHAAHEAGVIHRDIKPGNLIVTKDGQPVILDFGLAQEVDDDHSTLTLTGELAGTPAYMSPEQLMAQRIRLDRRTDVYSLGVSLYECLTLTRPFDGPTRERLYQAILTRDASDPRRLNPALPRDLRVVLDAALEKDRDRRYKTALDLAEDLRRLRLREPVLAKSFGPLLRMRRWCQRNPALAAALSGAFAILLCGLGVTIYFLGRVSAENKATQAALRQVDEERQLKDLAVAREEALKRQIRGNLTRELKSTPTELTNPDTFAMSIEEAKKAYDSGVQFFDARVREDYDAGHIKGAVLIDPTDETVIRATTTPDYLKRFDPALPVIVYCDDHDCDSAQFVGIKLRKLGFADVKIFSEGFSTWKAKGYQVEPK